MVVMQFHAMFLSNFSLSLNTVSYMFLLCNLLDTCVRISYFLDKKSYFIKYFFNNVFDKNWRMVTFNWWVQNHLKSCSAHNVYASVSGIIYIYKFHQNVRLVNYHSILIDWQLRLIDFNFMKLCMLLIIICICTY